MTVHASKDFIDTLRGDADMRSPLAIPRREWDLLSAPACGPVAIGRVTWAFGGNPSQGFVEVLDGPDRKALLPNCPDCLRLMREATDPVRYDFLRERGLVPELPLVSG